MAPKSNVPIRICGSKTRSGCSTCKQRHVKCDEGHPVCARCHKANRQCVYEPAQVQQLSRTSTTTCDLTGSIRTLRFCSNDPRRPTVLSSFGSHEVTEICALKHFATYVGKELAGCFSRHVWCYVLPLVAQHEPSVWHAVVAVGMLDAGLRQDRKGHEDTVDDSKAVQHYCKAIRSLQVRLGSDADIGHRHIVLLCCLLFAVFECLQGRYQAALRHISGGTNLLMQWRAEVPTNGKEGLHNSCMLNALQPPFLALDSQAVQMGAVGFRDQLSLPAMDSSSLLSSTSATIENAHLFLNHIFNRLSRWAQWVEPVTASGSRPADEWMKTEERKLHAKMMHWDATFEVLLTTSKSSPSAMLLLAQRIVIRIFFEKHLEGPSEMVWDNYLPLFRAAVEYAETYLALINNEGRSGSGDADPDVHCSRTSRPIFVATMDIVMPLFLISTRCRDSTTRRRALVMLKICKRKEGVWDSDLCAKMVESIIDLEESSATTDGHIPENARITGMDVQFDETSAQESSSVKLVRAQVDKPHPGVCVQG